MDLRPQTFRHLASGKPTDFSNRGGLPDELECYLIDREGVCMPRTIEDYRKRISVFLEFARKSATEIDRNDIRLYILHMKEKGLSPFSIKSTYRVLSAFFNWMAKDGMIEESPMKNLTPPRMPHRLGKGFITEQEFQRLLSMTETKDFRGDRDRAWLMLLWTTGCRFSELANLQQDDLDWAGNKIQVIGKGDRERVVPFTPPAKKAVIRYLRRRKDSYSCLWLNDRGYPLEKQGLASLTKRLFLRADIKVKDIHHIFRRSWAMRNLKAGIPPKHITLVGGWASLSMLEHYVKAMVSEDVIGGKWV